MGGLSVVMIVLKKKTTTKTSGWINNIDERMKAFHFFACSTKSSKEQSVLIPGQAFFAGSQLSLSFTMAGKKGHKAHIAGFTGCIRHFFFGLKYKQNPSCPERIYSRPCRCSQDRETNSSAVSLRKAAILLTSPFSKTMPPSPKQHSPHARHLNASIYHTPNFVCDP